MEAKTIRAWAHKDVWKLAGDKFCVEVSRHAVPFSDESGCYDAEGPHRWCVYGYVYPGHRMFDLLTPDGNAWEQPLPDMHGGCTYFRTHRRDAETITCFQFGADYHHLHDWRFTQMATKEDAFEVFADAQELFAALTPESVS
jgi:hypothetical protein